MKWNRLTDKKPRNGSNVYFLTYYCQGITFERVRLGEVIKQNDNVYFDEMEGINTYSSNMVNKWIYEKEFLKELNKER